MGSSKAFQQISTFLLQIGIFDAGACKNIREDRARITLTMRMIVEDINMIRDEGNVVNVQLGSSNNR